MVKPDAHNKFVEAHELYSFFMSAKTGDNVSSTLQRVAADLAGVVLTKPEQDTAAKVVPAQIINHPKEEPEDGSHAPGGSKAGGKNKGKDKKGCSLQ
jgi:Ras-related protein Rab-28